MRIQLITAFILTTLLLATASLPAAAPATPPGAITHFTEGDKDFTLTSAPDGHLTLLARTFTGQLLYNGPYTTPIERAEVPAALRCTLRLAQVRHAIRLDPGAEWDVIGPTVAKVIQDQAWLEVDFQSDLLVFTQPKLADPDNPLAAPANKLATQLDPNPAGGFVADADLKTTMVAFRDARKKLLDSLSNDQMDLRKISTIRQEAIYIRLGIMN